VLIFVNKSNPVPVSHILTWKKIDVKCQFLEAILTKPLLFCQAALNGYHKDKALPKRTFL